MYLKKEIESEQKMVIVTRFTMVCVQNTKILSIFQPKLMHDNLAANGLSWLVEMLDL